MRRGPWSKPKPSNPLRNGDSCPDCGKRLMAVRARSLLSFFLERDWLVCEGAPHCEFFRRMR